MAKKEKPDAWMPLYIGDYLADTGRLTTEQHGAYILLIMDYWRNGAPPDDDAELAEITRLDLRAWRRTRPKLERLFRVEDGRWSHKRIDKELAGAEERSGKAAAKARAAADARWESERRRKGDATGMLGASAKQCLTDAHHLSPVTCSSDEDKSSSAGEAIRADPGKLAWDMAKLMLRDREGMTPDAAGKFFGGLLARHRLEARDLLAAVTAAQINETQRPRDYLAKAAEGIAKRREPIVAKRVGFV